MMKCDDMWDLLSVWSDGEASSEEARIVEEHLRSCEHCRAEASFLKGSGLILSQMPEVEPPLELHRLILDATVNRPTLIGRLRAAWQSLPVPMPMRAMGLVAASLLLASVIALNHHQPQPSGNPVIAQLAPLSVNLPGLPPALNKKENSIVSALPSPIVGVAVKSPRSVTKRSFEGKRLAPKMSFTWAPREETNRRKPSQEIRLSHIGGASMSEMRMKAPSSDDIASASIATAPTTSVVPSTVTKPSVSVSTTVTNITPPVATVPPTPQVDREPVHIVLASMPSAVNPEQMATLSNLKNSLRQQNSEWSVPASVRTDNHEIRVDLLKSNF